MKRILAVLGALITAFSAILAFNIIQNANASTPPPPSGSSAWINDYSGHYIYDADGGTQGVKVVTNVNNATVLGSAQNCNGNGFCEHIINLGCLTWNDSVQAVVDNTSCQGLDSQLWKLFTYSNGGRTVYGWQNLYVNKNYTCSGDGIGIYMEESTVNHPVQMNCGADDGAIWQDQGWYT